MSFLSIAQAVNSVKEYYLKQGAELSQLRLRLTLATNGNFTVNRVDNDGTAFAFKKSGAIVSADPIIQKPGTYFLRPDNFGQFHPETGKKEALKWAKQEIAALNIPNVSHHISDEITTFTIRISAGNKCVVSRTFGKKPFLADRSML